MYFHNILSTLIAWNTWLWNIIFMLKVRWLREKDSSSCLITKISVPEVFYFALDWIWRSPTGSWVWMLGALLVTLHVEAVASLWWEAWLVVLCFECYNPFLQAELSASQSTSSIRNCHFLFWCCRWAVTAAMPCYSELYLMKLSVKAKSVSCSCQSFITITGKVFMLCSHASFSKNCQFQWVTITLATAITLQEAEPCL